MRGGAEIWGTLVGIAPGYNQPPCRFYLDAMRQFTKVRVMGGDGNPCRELAVKQGAYTEPFDNRLDLIRMIYAHNIVLARSSRSHGVLALSPLKKKFWLFDQEIEKLDEHLWWYGYDPRMFGEGLNCMTSPQFRKATRPWKATPEQIDFILNETCSWEEFEYRNIAHEATRR
jgi:hypothetical protein